MKVRARKVCHTCRARKLGCDGKVPACSQCLVRGYKCAGYQHEFIFRPPEGTSSFKKTSHRRNKPKNVSKNPINPPAEKDVQVLRQHGQATIEPEQAIRQTTMARSLSWPLLDMISLLVQNFTPVGYSSTSAVSALSPPRICGAWIEALPELASKGEHEHVLSSAIKAFATSILAQGCEGRAPVCDALRAYGLGLQSLRNGLQDQKGFSNVFIAAAMCLFLSELILPTCNEGVEVHVKGIQGLMGLSSPERYASGDSHKLFAGFRPVLIVQSLISRRPNFVAQDQWNAAPFSQIPMNSLQAMMTKATALPSILGKIDYANSTSSSASVDVARDALVELVKILTLLSQWSQSSDAVSHGYQWVPLSSHEAAIGLWFPDITTANAFTHFWAFWVMCVENIRQLKLDFPDLETAIVDVNGQSLERILMIEEVVEICGWLLLGVEFLIQDEFKLFGVASTVLPVKTAYETLLRHKESGGAETLNKHQRVLDKISGKGYHFLDQLKLVNA
ncbi:N-terminal fungal transcription regulatory domain-containing protein [Thelonectria olida]|uniref:N-terminal fungal transcription regulatory domain-containing protein n=1 Tax=Thelonectria olida TaxID=1576542 RepID=A0A9P8VUA0_9HYPO|nr:N-terminal fungal transcription regulatory domain-containing protein [Thelonectria olida]